MKKNVLIWGTGKNGDETYRLLLAHRNYQILAFGDNAARGEAKKNGLPIVNADGMLKLEHLDCIVIASTAHKEIKEQIEKIVQIPIYSNVTELVFTRISIDISGYCNAKCKWCITGRKNRENRKIDNQYMRYTEFVKLYLHLYNHHIIEKSTEIMLYSWGEPLLNEDYIAIIEFLSEQKQCYSVSTNASIVRLTDKDDCYQYCRSFVFSMPGFSQASYKKIHGFNFEQIRNNIIVLNNNLVRGSFQGDKSLSFHLYKFNSTEIKEARNFAESLGIRFNPNYPYFNGYSMEKDYLENRMSNELKKEAESELFLGHVKTLLEQRPKGYQCGLTDILSIDYKADLVLCCASDPFTLDYCWGSIYNIESFEQMKQERAKMLQCTTCKVCGELKMDYWLDHNPSYEETEESDKINEE